MLEPDLIETRKGNTGRITLNRPAALNAMTHDMVRRMARILSEWEADPTITLILVDGAGDKAFCAGGDVAALYAAGKAGRFEEVIAFWRDMYALDLQIAELKTPYVAFMDGITMGAGVGIGAHGAHRVVTERTMFALPECGIGLVPDVGASYLLAALPEGIARYIALTGARLRGADCVALGLADHLIAAADKAELIASLVAAGGPDPLSQLPPPAEPGEIHDVADQVTTALAGLDVHRMVGQLEALSAGWAQRAAKALRAGSPTSQGLALRLLQQARDDRDLRRCLARDLEAATYCLKSGDFLEGVRAAIIDKDKMPTWRALQPTSPAL
ncbi:enoyl-CoA hydratase/isomerase family protein [Marinovum sp.]|uniref:enoyl-CoA hydratase/isomerase family protein n=1 Tax=Marinovum sp. TaxID=2024839 RepID=UPI003A8DB909